MIIVFVFKSIFLLDVFNILIFIFYSLDSKSLFLLKSLVNNLNIWQSFQSCYLINSHFLFLQFLILIFLYLFINLYVLISLLIRIHDLLPFYIHSISNKIQVFFSWRKCPCSKKIRLFFYLFIFYEFLWTSIQSSLKKQLIYIPQIFFYLLLLFLQFNWNLCGFYGIITFVLNLSIWKFFRFS